MERFLLLFVAMISLASKHRVRAVLVHAVLTLVASLCAATRVVPDLPAAETIVVEEAYRMVEELGEEIWPGFSAVPFPVLLVGDEFEFLLGWEGPSPAGFHTGIVDAKLGPVLFRGRVFSPGLSAALPAFGPPSVVVIGTMENTGRSAAEWALTLLHEHFHQLQYAGDGYQADVEGLDLAGGDTSGMWMLEYPFPYGDEAIGAIFAQLAAALSREVGGSGPARPIVEDRPGGTAGAPADPWAVLDRLLASLEPADRRYLSFQLWQEGVARFVEARAAEVLANEFEAGAAFLSLGDFAGWANEAEAQRRRIRAGLDEASLEERQRVSFYPAGAALAMLLERGDPEWKNRYEEPRFSLERYARASDGVDLTYLANEGFLLAAGDHKVLIDALFPGIDGYPRVPPKVGSRIARAEAPFDGVDVVLATHFHRDHYGASEVARHLGASAAVFVSTPDAVARLRREAGGPFDSLARYPDEGEASVLTIDDGLGVTIFNLHHGRSRPEIQNLGFLVEIGGLKILHVGDTEVKVADVAPLELGEKEIDVALLPGWLLAEPSWRPVVAEIGARHLVVMHLASPDAPASWFGSAGSLEGRIGLIREHFPDAWIPTEPLASRRYVP